MDLDEPDEEPEKSILECNEVSSSKATSPRDEPVPRTPLGTLAQPEVIASTPDNITSKIITRQGSKTLQKTSKVMPLVTGATGEVRYKPFRLGDVQAIVDKMPPVAEGGGLWLEQMGKVTAGHTLALGDFRAVAARCFTVQDLHDIEEAAGLMTEQDDEPLADFIFNISTVLRERYPVSVAAAIPKFLWKPDQHPRAYLEQCKEEWVRKTGQHPGRDESKQWFRTAVLEGVPVLVKQRMCDNPDLPGSDSPVWEKHLVHHLQVAKDKTDKEMQEVQDLQTQLLRLKLGKAREQASEKKKQDKLQMVTSKAPLGPEGEYLANPPNWSNQQSAPHGSG
ncbi:uncharacterized protein LOC106512235 [Austrofundulus limnaeus]|uniref:Uncharacterized protein LOC106512235 n=1 Tax=Austrofundulus limnaeus TaxID=52670 RepID=A0A2I4ALI5_AUSLI|nr:PREDICTED: uncharacterized protein LOC106512235 [Austrofundulus limnaeus]